MINVPMKDRLFWFLVLPSSVILQLVVLVPFTLASGLLAPLGAVIILHIVWVCASVVLIVLLRRRSMFTFLVPVINAVVWWVTLAAGDAWLGWTA